MNATAPAVAASDLPALRPGASPADAGRAEALRLLACHYGMTSYSAAVDFDTVVADVADGPAPQEFKDAFAATLTALAAALTG